MNLLKMDKLAFALVLVLLNILTAESHVGCGIHHPTELEARERNDEEEIIFKRGKATERQTIEYAVNWHVIHWGNPNIASVNQLESMINVSNSYFAPVNMKLRTSTVEFVDAQALNKPGWYNLRQGSADQTEMKNALSIGASRNLNVYIADLRFYAGWSTFPWEYSSNPKYDGICLFWSEISSSPGFVDEWIFVHEVGHWLGLYHTFQDGCNGNGDYVADTPAELESHDNCNAVTDSCPNLAGVDPINNTMNYGWACRFELTPGQYQRISNQVSLYRNDAPVWANGPPPASPATTRPLTTGPVTTRSLTTAVTTKAVTTRTLTTRAPTTTGCSAKRYSDEGYEIDMTPREEIEVLKQRIAELEQLL